MSQLILPEITQKAMKENLEAQMLKEHKVFFNNWIKDKSRVNQFGSLYDSTFFNKDNPYVIIEIYKWFPKEKGMLEAETRTGLTLNQERYFTLYPFAKDLATGIVYIIPDFFVSLHLNEAHLEWQALRAEKPSLEDTTQQPPEFLYGCDIEWNKQRFIVDKFKDKLDVHDVYTFRIPRSILIAPLNSKYTANIKDTE